MIFKVKKYDVHASEPLILLDSEDCIKLGVKEGDRVMISGERSTIALAFHSEDMVEPGTAIIPTSILEKTGIGKDGTVDIIFTHPPESVRFIRKKMDGEKLSKDEINDI